MLIAALGQYFFGITIFITSMFLIMLVLVQRGRGGGLAGALGGPGGQSAFGTKAGDLFTRITIGVATVWIFLCAAAVVSLKAKKFTTDVTRTESSSGSMGGTVDSGAGDAGSGTTTPGTGTPDTGSSLESALPNASTTGLDLTPPATITPTETAAPADATTEAEVSELSPTEPTSDLPLDDPAGIQPPEQP